MSEPETLDTSMGSLPSHGAPEGGESFENDATEVSPRVGSSAVELPTPTEIDPMDGFGPGSTTGSGTAAASADSVPAGPEPSGTPTELTARPERSEPIVAISMKARTEQQKARADEQRVPLHVQLRALAEVSGQHAAQIDLGNLAPPRDPREVRARRVRSNVARACVAVVLAAAIALAIWLVAGR
jgi:hypothetical protein